MKPGAAIINTTSIKSNVPTRSCCAYATTKGAIPNFTAGLAQMLAERGIRVNAVAPGPDLDAADPLDHAGGEGREVRQQRPDGAPRPAGGAGTGLRAAGRRWRATCPAPPHAPLPDGHELQLQLPINAPAVPRPQLQQGRRDALLAPRRPAGVRAEHGRRAGAPTSERYGDDGDLARRRRHGAQRPTRCAPRTTTSASPARSCARSCRRPTATTSSTNILGHAGDPDVQPTR